MSAAERNFDYRREIVVPRNTCYVAKQRFASEARLRSTKRCFATGARLLVASFFRPLSASSCWALIVSQLAPARATRLRRALVTR